MSKNNKPEIEKVNENDFPITTSDWIVYLEGISSHNTNLYVGFFTAMVVLIIAITNFTDVLITIIAITFAYVLFLVVNHIMRKKIDKWRDLSERIIFGEFKDSNEILAEYKRIKQEK